MSNQVQILNLWDKIQEYRIQYEDHVQRMPNKVLFTTAPKCTLNAPVVTEMAALHSFYTKGNVACTVTSQQYTSLSQQSIIPAIQALITR